MTTPPDPAAPRPQPESPAEAPAQGPDAPAPEETAPAAPPAALRPAPRARSIPSAGPADTEAIGARLAGELGPGALVLLEGEVGAGKTTLVRGAARALGHDGRVASPTFTLAARYEGGRVPVSHLDLYRLRDAGADAEELALLEDELAADRIVFVEWPEAVSLDELVAGHPRAVRVILRHAGGDRRDVEVIGA